MEFSKYFDHTLLKADATEEQIMKVCQEAVQYQFASVCVNSYYTELVAGQLLDTDVKVCSVVGFPLGMMSTLSKQFEAVTAIEAGADEIDMVINVGALKDQKDEIVLEDIKALTHACKHNSLGKDVALKVIIETCLLTEDEKKRACELVVKAGADFVKTSTGFSTGGATKEDVALMKEMVAEKAKVKASGGIRDYKTAMEMIKAGADRLGTSATVAIMEAYQKTLG